MRTQEEEPMNTRNYCLVSSLVIVVIAIAHLVRAALNVPVLVGSFNAPMSISWAAGVVGLALAAWGFRSSRAGG
jgi:hypothetical protein